jgi:hypothetical protein
MTPNEITTAIALKYSKTLDIPFKLALMERVDIWRSRHIRNSLEKDKKDRKFFIQTIYVPMTTQKEVPCSVPVPLCDVAVSDLLPNPLRANGVLFDFVGGVNGSNPFYQSEPGIFQYLRKGKYTGNRVMYDWINNKIVVYGAATVPMIRIDAVWDKPTQVSQFLCANNTTGTDANCDYWNNDYPCTNEIMQLIFQSIEQVDFKEKNVVALQDDIEVPVNPKTDA